MPILSYCNFFSAIVYCSLAVLVLIRNPRRGINRVSSVIFTCFFIWSFSDTVVHNPSVSEPTARFFVSIGSIGWLFFSGFFLWFVFFFTDIRLKKSIPFILAVFIIPALVLVQQLSGNFLYGNELKAYGWNAHWPQSVWTWLYYGYYFCMVLAGFALLIDYRKKNRIPAKRRQVEILLVSGTIPLVLGTITNVVAQLIGKGDFPPLATLFLLTWAFGLAYSIPKYQFLSVSPIVAAESIIATMSDLVLLITREGIIASVNRATLETLGYDQADLEGKPATIIFPAPMRNSDQVSWIWVGAKRRGVQENFMTRNGSLLPVNITTSPIADFGVVVVARDYSAEKAAVDELRRAKDDLEIIVAKRTSDLNTTNKELKAEIERRTAIEEHLRQAQKMDAIGQLAGGVAHDFNNMLGAILAVNDLMRMKFSDKHPDLKRYTDRIKDAGHSMAQLTAKLLAFARKGKLEMAVFDANDIIQEVIKLLKHSIDKRIAIHEALCTRPAFILCDKAQIQNALLNLALNARDAMPNGGTLKIISDIVAIDPVTGRFHGYVIPPGRYVLLAVSDTGTGMDDAVKAKLFEPFFTTKEMGKGTGLGLASVYGTVKGHGGYIHVDSAAGKGSVFTIHFPLREAPEPARKTTPSPLHQGKGCVLIVDDEELVRSTAAEILSDIGYSVATAGDGEEAVRYYGKHAKEVDLVVLDLIMPKLHGYECFMELKKNNPQVKVIIMSGYALEGEAKKAIDQGALGFVQKPYELGVFTKAIADALEGKPIH